ncbi:MAG: thioredoxin [Candidatus Ancillula sp.]|jgi:thioredoxin 1|nr:thioredoxin [Candidatus Ancillula sp.]
MATISVDPKELEELAKGAKTVIVDFWAPWCGPCRHFGPLFEQVSEQHTDTVFVKVNVDEYQSFAAENAIMSIPTIWIFKDGKKVYNKPGSLNFSQLEELL